MRVPLLLALLALAPALRAQAPAEPPVLSPGDQVRIVVWGSNEKMGGDFEVAGDGTIAHPLFREVRAAGVPMQQVEAGVRRVLGVYEANPQFLVEPLFRVSVTGEVRQPNLLVLRPETTLLQAVARAGGVNERGRLDRVHLVRNGQAQVLDLTRPELGHAQMLIRSGDQVRVERRSNVFREYVAPSASIVAALAAVARLFVSP
ncbi:MAG TPA: polysaccharide biosynthesis/export family protein [Longimicrobium sp.]|nr:polysaccharide biosynthesis/export family protein [Longimicrobium sp.]